MKTEYNARGFQALEGQTIVRVDASSINVVHFHLQSGQTVSVDAEEQHYGIPVVSVSNWREAE